MPDEPPPPKLPPPPPFDLPLPGNPKGSFYDQGLQSRPPITPETRGRRWLPWIVVSLLLVVAGAAATLLLLRR